MNKIIGGLIVTGFVGATLVLSAQTGNSTTRPEPGTRTQTNGQSATPPVTFVGCVQKGNQAATGTAGTTGTTSTGSESFILANAMPSTASTSPDSSRRPNDSPAGRNAPTATGGSVSPGTTGTSSTSSGTSYILDGGTNVASHVGHRVEVTGQTVSNDHQTSTSTRNSTSTNNQAAGAANQHFRVTSIREVPGDCSAASSNSTQKPGVR